MSDLVQILEAARIASGLTNAARSTLLVIADAGPEGWYRAREITPRGRRKSTVTGRHEKGHHDRAVRSLQREGLVEVFTGDEGLARHGVERLTLKGQRVVSALRSDARIEPVDALAGFDSFFVIDDVVAQVPVEERFDQKLSRGDSFAIGRRTFEITDHAGVPVPHPRRPGVRALRRIANIKPGVLHDGKRWTWAVVLLSPVEERGDRTVMIDGFIPDNASGDLSSASRWLNSMVVEK